MIFDSFFGKTYLTDWNITPRPLNTSSEWTSVLTNNEEKLQKAYAQMISSEEEQEKIEEAHNISSDLADMLNKIDQ